MRTFACARCDQLVFFENTECLHCGAGLGFRWADRELVTLLDEFTGPPRCANAEVTQCNAFVEQPGASSRSSSSSTSSSCPGAAPLVSKLARCSGFRSFVPR